MIFVSATKIDVNTTNISTAVFHNKFTLCHIKSNIYIEKTKFAFHKQYLFSSPTSGNANSTKRNNPQTWQLQKRFPPVCMLLVQLASMNVFYYMW